MSESFDEYTKRILPQIKEDKEKIESGIKEIDRRREEEHRRYMEPPVPAEDLEEIKESMLENMEKAGDEEVIYSLQHLVTSLFENLANDKGNYKHKEVKSLFEELLKEVKNLELPRKTKKALVDAIEWDMTAYL